MAIQYQINSIKNVPGSKGERKYIKLHTSRSKSDKELYAHTEKVAGIRRGEVKDVMSAMQDYMVELLTGGINFYLPEIGYFSLSVELTDKGDEESASNKSSKKKVRVRGINFKPEKSLMERIQQEADFELSDYSTNSYRYKEEELCEKIKENFTQSQYLTINSLCKNFNLKRHVANRWLNHFLETGFLVKIGSGRIPVYVLAEEEK